MLSILTKSQCAECRQCCSFESYGLWDTPLVTDDIMRRALDICPTQRFSDISGRRLFVMEKQPGSDVYRCPMLDHSTGCRLGDGKPFECRIFPFRVMRLEGRLVIAVSPVCPAAADMSLSALIKEAGRLADAIFAEAEKEPGLVRQFEAGYVILKCK